MGIYKSVTQLIGRTPYYQINKLFPDSPAEIAAKLEFYNPGKSVKDRLATALIEDAESKGLLPSGGTIIEATSGNTGIALAMIGAARGFNVILTMPESMSLERRALLKAYGAKLILTPASEGMQGAVAKAQELAKHRDYYWTNQFANPANPEIHRKTTAMEIWEESAGKIDYFICGVGTGGTITGVGEVLKAKNPEIKIIAVEPAASPLLSAGITGPHPIQGIGANFIPPILNREIIDEILPQTEADAIYYAQKIAKTEGLLVGFSSGAALSAVAQLLTRAEVQGKKIVTILPSYGERYLSTSLFPKEN